MNRLIVIQIRTALLLLLLVFSVVKPAISQNKPKQGNPVNQRFCIKEPEMKLYRMVNDYRAQYNLPPIPLSKSLCYVAAVHAKDLMLYNPDQGDCNFHSWSNKGTWLPFCYPKDETKKASVWDKPKELTTYPAKAWEIVYWENTQMVPDSIMSVWKSEEYFNNYLLNTGKWLGQTWNAIGIAIFENYVCAWFGMAPDPEGTTYVCGTIPQQTVPKDSVKLVNPWKKQPVPKSKPKVADSLKRLKSDSVKGTSGGAKPILKTDSATVSSQPGLWYIIVKVNLTPQAAQKLVDDLRTKDYPDAKVLDNDGKIRVSVFGPADKPTAAAQLKSVKQVYRDAWLFRQ